MSLLGKIAVLFLVLFFVKTGCLCAQSLQSFTIPGTYSFIPPAGINSVSVEAWGAGGGGSSRTSNGRGGGGGGGAFAGGNVTVISGNVYSVVVGAGGVANGNGGNSSFNTTSIVAAGGSGGRSNSPTAGLGGSIAASSGVFVYAGGNGANAGTGSYSGGGGGGAGSNGPGGNAVSGGTAGVGAAFDGGNGGIGVQVSQDGLPGSSFGGGGSGAARSSGSQVGGNGAGGKVVVSWTCPSYIVESLSTTSSVCSGNSVFVTVNSTIAGLPVGTYSVAYSMRGANTGSAVQLMNVTTAGVGTFSTIPLVNPGVTTIGISCLYSGESPQICSTSFDPLVTKLDVELTAPVTITQQPVDKVECSERIVSFTVEASGSGLLYTWQRKKPTDAVFSTIVADPNVSYPSPETIRIQNAGGSNSPDGTSYQVIISNGFCNTVSNPAVLRINEITDVVPLAAIPSKTSVVICPERDFSYQVITSYPSNIVSCQWKKKTAVGIWSDLVDGTVISGTASNQLYFTSVSPNESGEYKVTVVFHSSGADCNVSSDNRTRKLTVLSALQAPVVNENQTICYNTTPVLLTATNATGGSGTNYLYQWQCSSDKEMWTTITGANSLTYQPGALTGSLYYRIVVADGGTYACGSASSEAVLITVKSPTDLESPIFDVIAPLCKNSVAPVLPTSSKNGITGSWSPSVISTATAGTTTYTFTPDAGQCAATVTLSVRVTDLVVTTFDAIASLCKNSVAPVLPSSSKNGITGSWSPSVISTATVGTTTYTFTPDAGQCAATSTLSVHVADLVVPTFDAIASLCKNSVAPVLPTSSKDGIAGSWSPSVISTATAGTTTYIFTPDAGQCAATATLSVPVADLVVPTFDAIASLCKNSVAPALPTSSKNGITGSWSPLVISTATVGTTTYTFTPDAGQCAATVALSVRVTDLVVPTFDAISSLCKNSVAPVLPTSSKNGITGSWLPSVISTATVGTSTYTFIPDAGQCAATATLSVLVTDLVVPTFDVIVPLCKNSVAPALPTSSKNGITGTWSPSVISTATAGTTTYTFTPDAGQCAATATLSVQIVDLVVPTFDVIALLCKNSVAPVLPTSSKNGITGTWSPSVISTSTVGTATYTFTPDAGQCAATTTLFVQVADLVAPTFDAIVPLCKNSVAPVLPTSSKNGITGSWLPSVISTATVGTSTYTFIPDAGQCAATATLSVQIVDFQTPLFSFVSSYYQNSPASVLPVLSDNGISGVWSPSVISTAAVGTTNYTFTPLAGQCAVPLVKAITITDLIIPDFEAIAPVCKNSIAPPLPTTSKNGIVGTWFPSTVSTSIAGILDYVFTPNSGQNATSVSLSVVVKEPIVPTFDAIASLCKNSVAPALPTSSKNGIPGTWFPSVISTATVGTTTYTFTPDAGQCAVTSTLSVQIVDFQTPLFSFVSSYYQNSPASVLPVLSDNGISGVWSPSVISTAAVGTTNYTFTPLAGQCAVPLVKAITITDLIIPDFDVIAPVCKGSIAPTLPARSKNGIVGTWLPPVVSTVIAGVADYLFTPNLGQNATSVSLSVVVKESIVPIFDVIAPLCKNSVAPVLPTSSKNGITGIWSPSVISTATVGTTTYTFTPDAGRCAVTATFSVHVADLVVPTFDAITPLCKNSVAPALPTSSKNGITGSWSPSVISTATVGTSTYTFIPNAGQCAATATLSVHVEDLVVPTFDAIASLCKNSVAPVLPTSSKNGITGSWSPSVISTATVGTSTYTFIPDAGQCAATTTLSVQIVDFQTPLFSFVSSYYQNSPASVLPVLSDNGISGVWSPSVISTAAVGTTNYTFTPLAGQCAVPLVKAITITDLIIPDFDAIAPVCKGSIAPTLPARSKNGIVGTWFPSTVSTAITGVTDYVFTPSSGQNASGVSLSVVVKEPTVPTFEAITPLCKNSVAPVLPSSSKNGIPGIWSPSVISTSTVGTATYTFTPDAGQCAATTTLFVQIVDFQTPLFSFVSSYYQNSPASVLPVLSDNGISGVWSPSVVSTAVVGTRSYTFTPLAGQCAVPLVKAITITDLIIPDFEAIAPVCKNSIAPTLPTTSKNGIVGTWFPSTVSTVITGVTDYVFTPNLGQNATSVSLSVVVKEPIVPVFDVIAPLCKNSVAPVLPSSSKNGIAGSWSPSVISTATVGTTTYTFTPDAGQCAATATLSVQIVDFQTPLFSFVSSYYQNSPASVLPVLSDNGISGVWSPSVISTAAVGTTNYTFTPLAGQCAVPLVKAITITDLIIPDFEAIAPVCKNSIAPTLPTTSKNGIVGTWFPSTVSTSIAGILDYVFTPNLGQNATSVSLSVVVKEPIAPVFDVIAPLCKNSVAPVLPTSSKNGITGSWLPMVISTSTVGTATYTFTPDAGQCAATATLSVQIVDFQTPLFSFVSSYYQNSPASVLPVLSDNGISGVWSPSVISTAAVGTTNYTFTPLAGQCAVPLVKAITVTDLIIPDFDAIAPVCKGSIAPTLPARSKNGIVGTWFPSTVSTAIAGILDYMFTPNSGQNATSVSLSVVVKEPIVPIFDAIASLCKNSVAPVLPTISKNGIAGSWSPSVISTAIVGTSTYTFIPDAGQCAATITLFVRIVDFQTPLFSFVSSYYQNSPASVLPVLSDNGISGVWSPSSISTTTVGTRSYTFTPLAGQCAVPLVKAITVTDLIIPDFDAIAPVCKNSIAPTLPTTSKNGIVGTWFPSTVSTAIAGILDYVFTPSAGQNATSVSLSVVVKEPIVPVFDVIAPLCKNSVAPALPTSSKNGITGSWSPSVISTATAGTTTYIFTPDAGQCAAKAALMVEVVSAPVNLPPVAIDDTFFASCSGVKANLTSNDFDPENDPFYLSLIPLVKPLYGSLILNSDGSFEYNVSTVYSGIDFFRYVIYDLLHSLGDTATVTIYVGFDADCDGIPNDLDVDSDGDGIMLAEEGGVSLDTDGDGIPNYLDVDSDNDGISDDQESQSHKKFISFSGKDSDHDGLDDAYDPDSGGTKIIPIDTDNDGLPDFLDSDSDADCVADYIEAFDFDSDGKPDVLPKGKDTDRDGLDDGFEQNLKSAKNPLLAKTYALFPDFDGDGDPDCRDMNDDNDEFLTKYEDLNGDGIYSNDDADQDGNPEYLDYGRECRLFIPDAFSPNGDNIHDYFQIFCIHRYPDAHLYIFDQNGNCLFEKEHYGNLDFWKTNEQAWWNGTMNYKYSKGFANKVLPGTYYYVLNLGNGDVRKSYVFVSY